MTKYAKHINFLMDLEALNLPDQIFKLNIKEFSHQNVNCVIQLTDEKNTKIRIVVSKWGTSVFRVADAETLNLRNIYKRGLIEEFWDYFPKEIQDAFIFNMDIIKGLE